MSNKIPQIEMMNIIKSCLDKNDIETTTACLDIYEKTFGKDNFYQYCQYSLLQKDGPTVSLICLSDDAASVNAFLEQQHYANVEIFCPSHTDLIQELTEYIHTTPSKYICFFESGYQYENCYLGFMVNLAETTPAADCVICCRNFIDPADTIIAHPDFRYAKKLNNTLLSGKILITHSLENSVNLYHSLSTLLLSTEYARSLTLTTNTVSADLQAIDLLYQLLLPANVFYTYHPLVSRILEAHTKSGGIEHFHTYLRSLVAKGTFPPAVLADTCPVETVSVISKDITFFYTDKGEYYNLKPIADEAKQRGYQVAFTDDIHAKAEIGIYCQHLCYPENSKFSVILLHDLAQGHNRWPNIWETERWNGFDLGILPGKCFAELWSQCACFSYANPRYGAYELGYPKSDLVTSEELAIHTKELAEKLQLKYPFSILYAPSWENDGKEHDFICALSGLPVNLLIKQAHWSAQYGHIIQNIREMRAMHEGKYKNVYYIEPEESILTALSLCDLVVSDESSVMAEALMFQKPSVAVTDWLIPDTTPSRFADVPMDYVIKTTKAQLLSCVSTVISNPGQYSNVLEKGRQVFSNIGNCCTDILDAIEYFTDQEHPSDLKPDFLKKKLHSKYAVCSFWN